MSEDKLLFLAESYLPNDEGEPYNDQARKALHKPNTSSVAGCCLVEIPHLGELAP